MLEEPSPLLGDGLAEVHPDPTVVNENVVHLLKGLRGSPQATGRKKNVSFRDERCAVVVTNNVPLNVEFALIASRRTHCGKSMQTL